MNKNILRATASLSGLAMALLACPVRAQAQSNSSGVASPVNAAQAGALAPAGGAPTSVGEIIVTARKVNERLSDVPVSVSVVPTDQLRKQGVVDVTDLAKVTSSFTFQQSSSATPVLSIRGVGFLNQSVGASPTVSAYIDQVPLPFSINTRGAVLDLERVEVLEGPQGTVFGQNSTAGSINFVPAKPTSEPHSAAEVSYSRFNEVDFEGYLSGPIANDLTGRLAIRTEQRFDGYQRTYLAGDDRTNGRKNFFTGRAILDWKPTSSFRAELSVNGWRDRSDTPALQYLSYAPHNVPGSPGQAAVLPTYPPAPRDPQAAEFDQDFSLRNNENQTQASLRIDADLPHGVTLTSISNYIDFNINLPVDLDGTSFPDLRINSVSKINTFTQELRFSNTRPSRLTWSVGANYENDNVPDNEVFTNYNVANNAIGPFVYQNFRELNKQIVDTVAGFANGEYSVLQNVKLQGGVRYTSQSRDFTGCFYDAGDGALSSAFSFLSGLLSGQPVTIPHGGCVSLGTDGRPVNIIHQSLNQDNVSWKGGLSWKPQSSTLLYVSATKGYKSGSFDTLPFVLATEATPVTQESLIDYEGGFKATILPRIFDLSGSVFYYDYRNKQSQGFIDTGIPFGNLPALITVPFSRVVGFEFSSVVHPIPPIRLALSGTYADSEVTKTFMTVDPFNNLVDIKGESLPDSPRFQFVGDSEYDHSLTDDLRGLVGASVTYRTGSRADFGGDPRLNIPSYALLGLRAGVSSKDNAWSLLVVGQNVTNRLYPLTINRFGDFVSQTAGFPSTFSVVLHHNFF